MAITIQKQLAPQTKNVDLFQGMVTVLPSKAVPEKSVPLPQLELEKRLKAATVPIFDLSGGFTGNGVAIAKDLILTCAHCVDGKEGLIDIDKEIDFKVVFSGTPYQLDFKILKIFKGELTPIELNVVPVIGQFLQVHFQENQRSRHLESVVNYAESVKDTFVTSDIITMKTEAGQSGAPRMSLNTKAVQAIHQGESEGLKINTIYHALHHASTHPKNPQMEAAKKIFSKVSFMNEDKAHTFWSHEGLNIGDVHEEGKPGLSREIVMKKGIFHDNFLDKHYARDKKEAEAIARCYSGRVTIFKISSEAYLEDIFNQVKKKECSITPSKAWDFFSKNGVVKLIDEQTDPTISINYLEGKVFHLNFMKER